MDEEEELENTLIGQEEEAPAVNTSDALMGAGQVDLTGQVNFRDYDVPEPPRTAALSVFTPSGDLKPGIDVNAITPSPATLPTPSVVNTALPQESGQLPQALPAFTAVATDQPQAAVSPFLQSPDTPSGLGGPLLRGFEMVNDAARGPNAPMGQDATRARLGGMTLNEYLNAPAGTPGVSGLRTDPQGRMISSPAPAVVNNFAPQASGGQTGPAKVPDEIMSQVVRTGGQTAEFRDGNRDGIEDREQGIFRPGELLGYDAQGNEVRAPGTQQPVNRGVVRDMLFRGPPSARPLLNDPPGFGTRPLPNDSASTRPNVDPGFIQQPSLRDPDAGFIQQPSLRDPDKGFTRPAPNLSDFERESIARQIRIGGTGSFAGDSAAREARLAARPDFNEVRRDSDRRGGISQSDARDLAQGMARGATEGERMRALEIQSRLGLGAFKRPTDLEQREIESRIRARDAEIARGETKSGFQPRLIDVGGERAMELSPGYFQRIPKDTPEKTGLQATLENLQSDLDSGRLTQEEYDIATKNATDLYIGREKPKGQTSSSEFENIITGAGAGGAPTVDATDAPQVATGRGQARRGRPIEGADASDIKSFATEAEARASGEKGEVLIGGRRAVIE